MKSSWSNRLHQGLKSLGINRVFFPTAVELAGITEKSYILCGSNNLLFVSQKPSKDFGLAVGGLFLPGSGRVGAFTTDVQEYSSIG